MITLSLTESQILTVLRAFLLDVLPAGTAVVQAQVNRVPEPIGPNFVLMTPFMRRRLATNEDSFDDTAFLGFISGTTLTVTDVEFGIIRIGAPVYGSGVLPNTYVTAFGTGTGGVGTYMVTPAQTVPSGDVLPFRILAQDGQPLLTQDGLWLITQAYVPAGTPVPMFVGTMSAKQSTMVSVQLDVHGPVSADNVQRITTLFRDAYACEFFAALEPALQPLYADDAKQIPFINGEAQVENRWVIDAVMQANPIVTVPQRFADEVLITLEPVA